jgi:carbonic anhydrase/acetyltransferase-like protein (isoleucine patch superfamily)
VLGRCVESLGDEEIFIGEETNAQDLSMMHVDPGYPAVLGNKVTIGQRAILRGATVEDDVLIGMGAILLNRAQGGSVIAAGEVITPGTEIPQNSLMAGLPAKVTREVRGSDREMIRHAFGSYVRKSDVHRGTEPLSSREVRG